MKLLEHLPNVLKETREYKYILGDLGAQPDYDSFDANIGLMLENQFIQYCDLSTIERFETMLGIEPQVDNIDIRRLSIIEALYGFVNYTLRRLRVSLNNLFGENGYYMQMFYDDYYLLISINTGWNGPLDEIEGWLRRIIPANISISLVISNTHGWLRRFTHGYLNQFTHKFIKEELS